MLLPHRARFFGLALLLALAPRPALAQDAAPEEDPETAAAKRVEEAKRLLEDMAIASGPRVHDVAVRLGKLAADSEPVLRAVAEGMSSDRPEVA
ncbi:MAG: hypothetical protein L0216_11700, partial [Planctomycetales bacterium]|nr:hypothetical protein [Planctomycetales bacterium]